MRANSGGNRLRQVRREIFEGRADDSSEPLRSKPPGPFINWDDPPDFQRFGGFLLCSVVTGIRRVSKDLELRLDNLQLARALVFFDLAVEGNQLAGHELVLE